MARRLLMALLDISGSYSEPDVSDSSLWWRLSAFFVALRPGSNGSGLTFYGTILSLSRLSEILPAS